MNFVKYYTVNEAQGYAIEKNNRKYSVVFVSRFVDVNGQERFEKQSSVYSNGKALTFPSPFQADYALRKEILPLYNKN